jgi:ribonuclease P protein component
VQRLKNRAQFQAALAGSTVSRTAHFALHRTGLDAPVPAPVDKKAPRAGRAAARPAESAGPAAQERSADAATGPGTAQGPKALFAVRGEPWVGAMVPKRWAKRAVTRNAIKRQIYTVIQDFEAQLPAAAHVVRLRSGFDRKQFVSATSDALKSAVRAELQQLFAGIRDKGAR